MMLDAARQQIRQGFRDKASLSASDPSVQPAIQHAEEVASFLKTNLVQGRREGDRYSAWRPAVRLVISALLNCCLPLVV